MKQNKPKTTNAKPTATQKVFDVSKPGGSAPNSSARPLIVTHRPMVQDPMMTPPPVDDPIAPTQGAPEVPKPILKPQQKIKLQPSPEAIQELAEQAAVEKEASLEPETEATAVSPVAVEQTSSSDAAVPVTVKTTPPSATLSVAEPTISAPEISASAAKLSSDASAKTTAAAAKKAAEADAEHIQQYEQVIDSRKYYVHIASPAKKRSMRLAVVGAILIILVAVGCADAMLDAGVLDISGLPHTNFIK